jgi:hypothetical protein
VATAATTCSDHVHCGPVLSTVRLCCDPELRLECVRGGSRVPHDEHHFRVIALAGACATAMAMGSATWRITWVGDQFCSLVLQLQERPIYVSHQNRDSTDRFVRRHIEHFSRLLKLATSKAERDRLTSLLAPRVGKGAWHGLANCDDPGNMVRAATTECPIPAPP